MNIEMCVDHCGENEQTLANLYVSKAITIVYNIGLLLTMCFRPKDEAKWHRYRSAHPPTSQIIMTYDRTTIWCFCVSATEWQRLPMFRCHGSRWWGSWFELPGLLSWERRRALWWKASNLNLFRYSLPMPINILKISYTARLNSLMLTVISLA